MWEREAGRCDDVRTVTLRSAVLEQSLQKGRKAAWLREAFCCAGCPRASGTPQCASSAGSAPFVCSRASHRSWKATSPKVNFLSFYKLTPGGCYSNCKASLRSWINKPDCQCGGRAGPPRERGRDWPSLQTGSCGARQTLRDARAALGPCLPLGSARRTSHRDPKDGGGPSVETLGRWTPQD